MIPVLIVQRVIYKQSIKMKDTVAALVISLGCFTYLSTVKSSVLESDAGKFWLISLGLIDADLPLQPFRMLS